MGRMASDAGGRAALVAEAARPVLEAAGLGPWLVAEDALTARALGATAWSRWCAGEAPGQATPPEGSVAQAALRAPPDREALEYAAHQLAARLAPGAHLWIYGHNDEGIKSAGGRLEGPLLRDGNTVATRRHCRIWRFTRGEGPAQAGLEPWWRSRPLAVDGIERPWWGLPGLFAKGGLDAATALLLRALTEGPAPGARLVDFGCGTGVIAAHLRARHPAARVVALDADALAVEATRRNAVGVEVRAGDGWRAVAGERFDRVVSNPPIHAGKLEDFAVLRGLVQGAPAHLSPAGELWMVILRQVPVGPLLAAAFATVEVRAEDGRFRVWRAAGPQEGR